MSAGGSIGSFGISAGSDLIGLGGLEDSAVFGGGGGGCCADWGVQFGMSKFGIGVKAFIAPLERKCEGGKELTSGVLESSSDISELVCLRSWLKRSFCSRLVRSLDMTD